MHWLLQFSREKMHISFYICAHFNFSIIEEIILNKVIVHFLPYIIILIVRKYICLLTIIRIILYYNNFLTSFSL